MTEEHQERDPSATFHADGSLTICKGGHSIRASLKRWHEAMVRLKRREDEAVDALIVSAIREVELGSSPRRTVAEVMEARSHAVSGGCCDRFADHMACDCLEEARRRELLIRRE